MKNVNVRVNGTKLVIEVDLSQSFGSSASGKSTIVASTEGAVKVPGHDAMRINCTVFEYPKRA